MMRVIAPCDDHGQLIGLQSGCRGARLVITGFQALAPAGEPNTASSATARATKVCPRHHCPEALLIPAVRGLVRTVLQLQCAAVRTAHQSSHLVPAGILLVIVAPVSSVLLVPLWRDLFCPQSNSLSPSHGSGMFDSCRLLAMAGATRDDCAGAAFVNLACRLRS